MEPLDFPQGASCLLSRDKVLIAIFQRSFSGINDNVKFVLVVLPAREREMKMLM
jgi:hypothetical protein